MNVNSGRWGDFAAGVSGGDLVSLTAFLFDINQGEAAHRLADMLGSWPMSYRFAPISGKPSPARSKKPDDWSAVFPVPGCSAATCRTLGARQTSCELDLSRWRRPIAGLGLALQRAQWRERISASDLLPQER